MKKLYFVLFLCVYTAITFGQNIAFEQVLPLPPAPQNIADFDDLSNSSIAFADIDNDNDQDVLIIGKDEFDQGITILYKNDGDGNFEEISGTPFQGVYEGSILFADIDNDNDQDVLITGLDNSDPPIAIPVLYTNDGDGNFTLETGTPFDEVSESSVAFADIDNDGDQDLLISGIFENDQILAKLFSNDGNGIFTELATNSLIGVCHGSIAFADIDNDNDQDVLISGAAEIDPWVMVSKLFTNDGNGNFTEVTGTPFTGVYECTIKFADIDNDNDQDVFIAGYNSGESTKLYSNDGNGNYTEIAGASFFPVYLASIAIADIDNDNDQDVLISGAYWQWPGGWGWPYLLPATILYSNDGSNNYTEVTDNSINGGYYGSAAFADINNDNDQDVLISSGEKLWGNCRSKLFINDGLGYFYKVGDSPIEGVENSSIAFADIDNDNDQDVLITGRSEWGEYISKLYTNDGIGNFIEVAGTPFDGVDLSSVAFADIDNDNDQDVLITGSNGANEITKLYTNMGNGVFTEVTGTPFPGVYDGSIAFADIDNDNDQDILITGRSPATAKLYTNDGNGNFSQVTGTPFIEVGFSSIAFTDIDNDNDMDVLITGWIAGAQPISKLYSNDGAGNFTEVTGTPFDDVSHGSVAFADIDNDGDQDVLITGDNALHIEIAKLYTNDGNGNYTLVPGTPFVGVDRSSIAFADLDNDGDQDVIITGKNVSSQHNTKLYLNDGTGNFAEFTEIPFEFVQIGAIAITDIDNDNDLDVLITGQNNNSEPISILYRNISLLSTKIPKENTVLKNVTIYPNPSKGQTTIDLGGLSNVSIKVYSMAGQLIYHKENIMDSKHQFELNTETGIYILEMSTQQEKQHYKLIKE